MRCRAGATLVGLVLLMGSTCLQGVAGAATVTCGQVITENTVLAGDVGPCEGNAIVIGADNITLDLGGHTVFGSPSDPFPDRSSYYSLPRDVVAEHSGIAVRTHHGVRIRNGTVTSFGVGIFVEWSDNVTLERLAVRENHCEGILLTGISLPEFHTANGALRENSITGNGCAGVLFGGRVTATTVERNVIADNAGAGLILHSLGGNLSARMTTARANAIYRNGGDGITVEDYSLYTDIVGNVVSLNGGNGIWMDPPSETTVEGNRITDNALNGVVAEAGASVQVRNNVATGNGAGSVTEPAYDLTDRRPGCIGNIWEGNQFITRNQPCIH